MLRLVTADGLLTSAAERVSWWNLPDCLFLKIYLVLFSRAAVLIQAYPESELQDAQRWRNNDLWLSVTGGNRSTVMNCWCEWCRIKLDIMRRLAPVRESSVSVISAEANATIMSVSNSDEMDDKISPLEKSEQTISSP